MNLEAINPYLTGRIVANEEESDPGVLTLKCSGVESSNPDYNRITLTSACYPSDYVSKFKGNFESEEVLQSVRELLVAMHLLEILVTSITGIQRQINGRMEESLLLLQIRNYLKIQTVL